MFDTLINFIQCKDNEKIIQQWEQQFPNKCIICSYHRFGYTNGMTIKPTPPKHDCKYTSKKDLKITS